MRRSRKPVWAASSIEGSNPSLSAETLGICVHAGNSRVLGAVGAAASFAAQGRSRPLHEGVFCPTIVPQGLWVGLPRALMRLRKIGVEEHGSFLFRAREEVAVAVEGDRD